LLQQLNKRVLESALEGENTDHPGYDKHDPADRRTGNSPTVVRTKTVLTAIAEVTIHVPRDRDASFDLRILIKRHKLL
jgi:putative transposase